MSALGQKQTFAPQQGMSALLPIATAKADILRFVMSALLLKADMCGATRDVCFGPKADSCTAQEKSYSISSSARSMSVGGIVRLSALAVVRLMGDALSS
jgi:hypothetical protein